MSSRFRVLAAVLAIAVLGVGCGRPSRNGADPWYVAPLPSDIHADDVMLQVAEVGGFVDRATVVTRLPTFTLYGDGRVITPAPVPAIYPAPALPMLTVQIVDAASVANLVQAAIIAGVGDATVNYGMPGITDMTSTRITAATSRGTLSTEAYALATTAGDANLTPAQQRARQRLRDFVDSLADLPHRTGVLHVGAAQPYVPRAVAAMTWPATEVPDLPAQPVQMWPGPPLPGATLGDLTCVLVTGADLTAVLNQASKANVLTPWSSGDRRWFVRLRPLLPDEGSCANLG